MEKLLALLAFCLLPYTTIALYDESSTRKINLEDIEDDYIQNERQSKSMPPPLSQQPAKGQPIQLYPPLSNEHYPIPIAHPFSTHSYSTRAHHQYAHVQPLTDQPTAPAEAGYQHQQQQSPSAYHGEEIVNLSPNGQEPPHNLQQMYAVVQQQPQLAPHFYYSHDLPPHQQPNGNGNENGNDNEYQLQFVPIDQHSGSDEQQQQHSFHGPSSQVTVPSTDAPVEPVSYSHDMTYDAAPQAEIQQHPQQQQHEPAQYLFNNGIHAQHVYALPMDVLSQSQKDIEYAKPAETYGPPTIEYFQNNEEYSQRDYSQDVTSPKSSPSPLPPPKQSYQPQMSYSDQIKSVQYQPSQIDSSSSNSQTSYRQNSKAQDSSALSYGYENKLGQVSKTSSEPQSYYSTPQNGFKYSQGAEDNKKPAITKGYQNFPTPLAPSETQAYYLNHLKDIKSVHHDESGAQKPAITYGPPDTVGKEPQIEYGVPEAPFRRPVAQSNQDIYAPRRPISSDRSHNGKSFAVSFPYPPSFISLTTEKSFTEKSTEEPSSNNEINPWRPLYVKPSTENQYHSFGQTSDSSQSHHQPLPDYFHTRRAKSLLDSYIPSWLITRMQEEHARQAQQGQGHQKQQSYPIETPQSEDSYNTISYSSNENVYGNHFKRSVPKKKSHQKKKVSTSHEEMTAIE